MKLIKAHVGIGGLVPGSVGYVEDALADMAIAKGYASDAAKLSGRVPSFSGLTIDTGLPGTAGLVITTDPAATGTSTPESDHAPSEGFATGGVVNWDEPTYVDES